MPKPLSDQVIVVVGASSGIGLATAREAARRGARVVVAARNAAALERAAEEIRRDGGEALAVPADVTENGQVEALARRAVEAYGRIDTWVGNAAVSLYATFADASPEDFRRVVETNFFGQVNGARAALPYLEESGGALVVVGSTLSDRGVPLQGAYCASKHALKGWLDALRVELRKAGSPVRVTLVKPSSIDTPLFAKAKTQLGVAPMPIPPVYEPRLAAAAILQAAEGNLRDVFVGGAGKAFSLAERLSPRLLDLHQLAFGFRAQRTSWPKSADAPNNLYGPVEDDGGVRGDFVALARRRSLYQAAARHPVGLPLAAAAVLAGAAALLRRTPGRGAPAALAAAGALWLTGRGVAAAVLGG